MMVAPPAPATWLAVGAGLALAACSGPPPSAPDAPLAARLARADAADGARIFRQCAACHTAGEGAGDRDGPNLWAIVGKPVATGSPRFAYTAALKAIGGIWSCPRLDEWLTNPRRLAPGTAMAFPGLADGQARADVIVYLAAQGGGACSGQR